VSARRRGEEVSIISILEAYQNRLRNSFLSARRALIDHIKHGAPLDAFLTALDELETVFDRLTLSVTLPSEGAPARQMDVVIKRQEEVAQGLTELRRMVEEGKLADALSQLSKVYEQMRLCIRLTMLVYAGWKTTLLRAAYPQVIEYIPAEEVGVADPLARRIYDLLLERGQMSASELAETFKEYSAERLNRALEELEARGLLRVFLRRGEPYFRVVA